MEDNKIMDSNLVDDNMIKISPKDMEEGSYQNIEKNTNSEIEKIEDNKNQIKVVEDHFETMSGKIKINDIDGLIEKPKGGSTMDMFFIKNKNENDKKQNPKISINNNNSLFAGISKLNKDYVDSFANTDAIEIPLNSSTNNNSENSSSSESSKTKKSISKEELIIINGLNSMDEPKIKNDITKVNEKENVNIEEKFDDENTIKALSFKVIFELLEKDIKYIECYLSLKEEHINQVQQTKEFISLLSELEWHVAKPCKKFAPNGEFALEMSGTPFVPLFASLTNEYFFLRKRFEDFQEYILLDIVATIDSFTILYKDSIEQLEKDFRCAISKCEKDLVHEKAKSSDSSKKSLDQMIDEEENSNLLGFKTIGDSNQAICLRALFRVLHPLRLSLHKLEVLRINKIKETFEKYIKSSQEFSKSFMQAFCSSSITTDHPSLTTENIFDQELHNILLSTESAGTNYLSSSKIIKTIDSILGTNKK